jgi:hypothetical protein
MALLGLPAWRYLTTDDPVERQVLVATLNRAVAITNRVNGGR